MSLTLWLLFYYLFYSSPHILTYRLTKQNPPQLSHQRLITLAAPLWDCGFDSSDRLWLLQQLNDDTLRLYDWTPEDGQQQVCIAFYLNE